MSGKSCVAKSEKGLCIAKKPTGKAKDKAAKEKKDVTNSLNYAIRKAPAFVKDFYDGEVKFMKYSAVEKEEFVKEVLNAESWDSDYFKRIQTVVTKEMTKDVETWVSWKAITDEDGEPLVRAQLAQGTLTKRFHAKLIPDAESTLALPEEERYQYSRCKENKIKEVGEVTEASRGAKGDDVPETKGDPVATLAKQMLSSVTKAHNSYQAAVITFKINFGKYDGNEYHGIGVGVGFQTFVRDSPRRHSIFHFRFKNFRFQI
jgi:hypothetical protein